MSFVQRMIAKLESGLITFINMVTLANRDLPYHDYLECDDSTGEIAYAVGQNQIDAHGNQSKRFVSKSTLVYCTDVTTLQFNDSKNVAVGIVAGVWYEFKSNIWQIFVHQLNDDAELRIYFEGVLPDEARSPE